MTSYVKIASFDQKCFAQKCPNMLFVEYVKIQKPLPHPIIGGGGDSTQINELSLIYEGSKLPPPKK